MKRYAAIQLEQGQDLVIEQIDIPDPSPTQVIVKLFSTGICHSQVHQMNDITTPRPLAFGHEATGVVTHIGDAVTHLKEGDHCIVTWVTRTPYTGRPDHTPAGATYKGNTLGCSCGIYTWANDCIVEEEHVIPIDKNEPTDISCIVGCAVLTGAGAVINTANVKARESVAVFGVGGVGLSAINMASIIGAYPIIAVDLLDEKLQFAKEFGATHLINSSIDDPIEKVFEIVPKGLDYAFDTVGVKSTTEQILPVTRSGGPGADNLGGVSILVGIPGAELKVDPRLILFHQRTYRGSLGATYPVKEFPMFLKLFREKKLFLDKLVTKVYSFDEIIDSYKDLDSGKILGRAIVKF